MQGHDKPTGSSRGVLEARLYKSVGEEAVKCFLCSFHCRIKEGRRGICGVRENRKGVLYTLVYGLLIAGNIDPIEKKPLFHFLPSTPSYSIATVGCNFKCLYCQNFDISQMPKDAGRIEGTEVSPEEVVLSAASSGCKSIAYTYTEPTIFFEFARDTGLLARERSIKNVFVTNGYMTRECLDESRAFLDAANVDIKSFSDDFYKKVCGARLAPVLESIEYMRELGIWVEVTTLLIPGYNDSEDEIRNIAKWISRTDKSMPWHISAFYPTYKLTDAPPTPSDTIMRAREIGLGEGLRYVYTGNIPGLKGESTFCYNCKKLLIERRGFYVKKNLIEASNCPFCGAVIDGIGL
ncbi:MAG: AmmeMemoRadiSam system radical SAM enzyme [Thermodesulfobacteriota bacterium]|nr:MAG: AmmeMemoRadiSam system radical SAM enzyme [Thermodesulfobacteriota bacterium]